jgi:hypothetical protein
MSFAGQQSAPNCALPAGPLGRLFCYAVREGGINARYTLGTELLVILQASFPPW